MIRKTVQFIHIISFCGVLICSALGVLYEIIGYSKFEQLLSSIGIANGYNLLLIVGIITLALLIITYVIKIKLFR